MPVVDGREGALAGFPEPVQEAGVQSRIEPYGEDLGPVGGHARSQQEGLRQRRVHSDPVRAERQRTEDHEDEHVPTEAELRKQLQRCECHARAVPRDAGPK